MKTLRFSFLALLAFFTLSCNPDRFIEQPLGEYQNGLFILNQGNFGAANSSISFLSNDLQTFVLDAFAATNADVTLGDTAQDIGFFENRMYVVVNNSNSVQVANRFTLNAETRITSQLNNPRYVAFGNGYLFVSNWGDGMSSTDDYIAVYSLLSFNHVVNIPVSEGPERMLVVGNELFVAHKGGFGFSDQISVIDTNQLNVSETITVGDVPDGIVEFQGNIYVLCSGKPGWSSTPTSGSLHRINPQTREVTQTWNFSSQNPNHLVAGTSLYYAIDNEVFAFTPSQSALPQTAIIQTGPQGVYGIYALAHKDGKIYLGDAGNFSERGYLYIYSLSGQLLHNQQVGVIPTGIYFN